MTKEKVIKALTKGVLLPVGVVSELLKIIDRENESHPSSPITLSDLIREGIDCVLVKYKK